MMTARTRLDLTNGIAVITIDNPPVNALGIDVVAELAAHVDSVVTNGDVAAAVLCGANGIFSGGADIHGFGKPATQGPTLRDVINAIDRGSKVFVAALEGIAFGGGLELAQACDYRVARKATRVGQPEIKLGLLPGAGGTQRLPRLIGLDAALEIDVGGEPISAERARELGLIDEIVENDVVDAALRFAAAHAAGGRRRARDLEVSGNTSAIEGARKRAEPAERGALAVHYTLDALEGALKLPFDDAIKQERALFERLRESEQSKARIHIFFAEREAAKVPGVPRSSYKARTAAVIGSGTMGGGISMALANAGIDVTVIDLDEALVQRAKETIARNYDATFKKGRLSRDEMDRRLGRLHFATSLDAAADVDLIIEAVFEEMDVKKDVFRKIDGLARTDAILATNTSTLDIDAIASVTSRPERVIGTHFFSPANVMKLLEIVRGDKTSPELIGDALSLAKQLAKVGVVSGNCDGFIGNRMLAHYRREADFLLEEGATPQQIDRVIREFGFPMGPYAMVDLAGLDISWRVRKRRNAERPPLGRYSKVQDRLCEMGRFGQKTGCGFYRYESGDRTPIPDPEVDALIRATAREAGIEQREITDDEIRKRCIYALVNEGCNVLADGIAIRAGDVDVVWVYGYAFPSWRGGPLRYAQSVGLRAVYDDILAFRNAHGVYWTPSPLLEKLATSGGTFT
ncbi:MAG TPA: 3-hydroxyacyl-CoA dehydrogenase NAD-binding domain-containing protein [Candidatus Acidoferrales bacterium]|nr:3-hydroxyacyl-CoA dehydrogenase NAD-binding domain-containing protein [Candidatus Acidoferrales bacterium]